MKDLARALRRHGSDAERWLWHRLRGRQLGGFKFRRQQVLGPYIVDFLCLQLNLIIEIDGAGSTPSKSKRTQRRTEYLQALGYRMIRFWNSEVLRDPDAVLESIRAALD